MIASIKVRNKLPADSAHPIFSVSMNRKTRYAYDGQFFRYREGSDEYDYPSRTPTANDVFLVKLYDQKYRTDMPQNDAVQLDQAKQPRVLNSNGKYYASFNLGEYLEFTNNPGELITSNFTITTIGDGDVPRPMLGVYGDVDVISVEPGETTSRFKFNEYFGSISQNSSNRINQMFSGVDPAQNNQRVLLMKSEDSGSGQNLSSDTSTNFHTIAIGRAQDRYFKGDFIEATLHVSLSKVGASRIWEEAKVFY